MVNRRDHRGRAGRAAAESLRWAAGPDGELRPVVRIVITAHGNEREIRQHGPDGELLRTTFGTVDA